MKYILSILALFGLMFILPNTRVKAEEIEQPETTETETPETEETEKKEIEDYVVEIAEKYLKLFCKKTEKI